MSAGLEFCWTLPIDIKSPPTDSPWTTKKTKMLIGKRQAAFTRDGKDSPSYKLLKNKVQRDISLTAGFEPLFGPEPIIQQVPPGLLVSVKEVQNSLASLNVGKAIGADMLPNRVLKEFALELALPIMSIYNRSLVEGYVPDLIKRSIINPLPKVSPQKGNPVGLKTNFSHLYPCQGYGGFCSK